MDFKKEKQGYFPAHAPRDDLQEEFPPDLLEDDAPLLLHELRDCVAIQVAATVLLEVSHRAGSRIKPSALEHILQHVKRTLPEHALHHANDEARRVLEWLSQPTEHNQDDEEGPYDAIETMTSAEIHTRRAVALQALENDMDVELEFFDPALQLWTRARVKPLEVTQDAIVFTSANHTRTISLQYVRWIMPVQTIAPLSHVPRPVAEVISFPRVFAIQGEEE